MNYTEAIESVDNGYYCWRTAWPTGTYIYLVNGEIGYFTPEGQTEYQPTEQDKAALDWDRGDSPPHP